MKAKQEIVKDQKSKIKPKKNGLNALSFFSGAMGLDIGLEKVGIRSLLACENDKHARKTIIANNPDIGLIGDIRNYSTNQILEFAGIDASDVDLIAGGPPCQAFSTAGKRKNFEDERGNVFLKFIELIEQIKPKYFVIENVRGLLSSEFSLDLTSEEQMFLPEEYKNVKGAAMYYVMNRLKANDYSISFNLYNAANYGTPQIRERVVIIGALGNHSVPHLTPTHSEGGQFDLPRWRKLKDAIGNLSERDMDHIEFPEKRLKYYRILKEGQNWRNLPIDLQKEAMGKSYELSGGKTGFLRRLAWDKPSPTLVTHPAMPATDLAHPVKDRPLSVQEYKRIQEFPDNWILKGNLTQQYKQIGNAVPVSLGRAIGLAIQNHAEGNQVPAFEGFKYSRYKNTSETEFPINFVKVGKKKLMEQVNN